MPFYPSFPYWHFKQVSTYRTVPSGCCSRTGCGHPPTWFRHCADMSSVRILLPHWNQPRKKLWHFDALWDLEVLKYKQNSVMSFQIARKSFFWRVSYQFDQTLYSRPVRDWKRPFKRLLNGNIVKCFKTVAASQRRSVAAGQEECPDWGRKRWRIRS